MCVILFSCMCEIVVGLVRKIMNFCTPWKLSTIQYNNYYVWGIKVYTLLHTCVIRETSVSVSVVPSSTVEDTETTEVYYCWYSGIIIYAKQAEVVHRFSFSHLYSVVMLECMCKDTKIFLTCGFPW